MLKKMLRQQVLDLLKNQDITMKKEMDRWLMDRLISHPAYLMAQVVATYLPLSFEVATNDLIAHALANGKRLLVPKVLSEGEMIFVTYDPDDVIKSPFGVWEPRSSIPVPSSDIDLIHVPGVVFNQEGYRIGFGGGFYDRYLADYEGMTISTAYPIQCRCFEPDAYDIAVKEVLRYDESF